VVFRNYLAYLVLGGPDQQAILRGFDGRNILMTLGTEVRNAMARTPLPVTRGPPNLDRAERHPVRGRFFHWASSAGAFESRASGRRAAETSGSDNNATYPGAWRSADFRSGHILVCRLHRRRLGGSQFAAMVAKQGLILTGRRCGNRTMLLNNRPYDH
jgi:hypothetical protein